MTRKECLQLILDSIGPWPLVLTTGHTCRDAFELGDRDGNFYMLGSMGLAASIAIGVAMESRIPTFIVEGDGSLLMNPGNLILAGHFQPDFVHIVLDNGRYESTGGQETLSGGTDFIAIAQACGYRHCERIASLEQLRAALSLSFPLAGPRFLYIPIEAAATSVAPRVSLPLPELHQRFKRHLENLRREWAAASEPPERAKAPPKNEG